MDIFPALTCFGVDNTASRVYYLDTSGDVSGEKEYEGHVHELAWVGSGWVSKRII